MMYQTMHLIILRLLHMNQFYPCGQIKNQLHHRDLAIIASTKPQGLISLSKPAKAPTNEPLYSEINALKITLNSTHLRM